MVRSGACRGCCRHHLQVPAPRGSGGTDQGLSVLHETPTPMDDTRTSPSSTHASCTTCRAHQGDHAPGSRGVQPPTDAPLRWRCHRVTARSGRKRRRTRVVMWTRQPSGRWASRVLRTNGAARARSSPSSTTSGPGGLISSRPRRRLLAGSRRPQAHSMQETQPSTSVPVRAA